MNEKTGPFGTAEQQPIPDLPQAAQTVDHWLITAPAYHPGWSQYVLVCVRLDDNVPGFGPPKRQFAGATHELLVLALDPQHGPYDAEKLAHYAAKGGGLPFLTPINMADQFIATDDEMRELCALLAWGVVQGHLNPETGDAPALIREAWLTSCIKTLAHIRGEAHAR